QSATRENRVRAAVPTRCNRERRPTEPAVRASTPRAPGCERRHAVGAALRARESPEEPRSKTMSRTTKQRPQAYCEHLAGGLARVFGTKPGVSGPGRHGGTRRSRSVKPEVQGLEGRALLSTTSAVAWQSGRGVTHTALYAIDKSDQVEESVDGGSFTNLGGYSKQISAGLDVSNNSEVYAIGGDHAVWVNKGSGRVRLGLYAKEISATIGNTVYAIGTNDDV